MQGLVCLDLTGATHANRAGGVSRFTARVLKTSLWTEYEVAPGNALLGASTEVPRGLHEAPSGSRGFLAGRRILHIGSARRPQCCGSEPLPYPGRSAAVAAAKTPAAAGQMGRGGLAHGHDGGLHDIIAEFSARVLTGRLDAGR